MSADQRIYDAYIAGRQSAALAVGVRLGLFDQLADTPRSERGLAEVLGVPYRGVFQLCRALRAMGLLERRGANLALAPDADAVLVRGRPGWLGGLIDLEIENDLSPAKLLSAVRTGRSSIYGDLDPWEVHIDDPERAVAFTAAMHSLSEGPAETLAGLLALDGARELLDVGGGSGALSIALARAFPELHCILWDLEPVCDAAMEFVRAAGLERRIETRVGDLLVEPFPACDTVVFGQILHDWPPETGLELVAKAFDALAPGGQLVVHEKLIDDDGAGPLANALVDLDMLVWTEGQQWTPSGLRAVVEESGFVDFAVRPASGYWSVATAVKR